MAHNNPPSPAPLVLNYPQTTYGRGLPTAGLPSPLPQSSGSRNRLYALLQQPTVVTGQLDLIVFHYVANSCFRDAALTMLFGLKPFMNFLDSVSPPGQAPSQDGTLPSTMVRSLAKLGRAFWNQDLGNRSRQAAMNQAMNAFWSDWMTLGHTQVGSHRRLAQNDIHDFLTWFFSELANPTSHLQQRDITMLSQLCEREYNLRFAYSCGCQQKDRRRHNEGQKTWFLDVHWNSKESDFATAISMAMWTPLPELRFTCPFCGKAATGADEYSKFRTMPEILFVCPVPVNGHQHDALARFQIPEILDLSPVQDKPLGGQRELARPTGSEDDEDARPPLYQLQSLVAYDGSYIEGQDVGHYRAHLRRNDHRWDCLNSYVKAPVPQGTLRGIETDRSFQARILAYVRQERPEMIAAALNQSATHVSATGDGNSIRQDTTGTSQVLDTSQNTPDQTSTTNTQADLIPPQPSNQPAGNTSVNHSPIRAASRDPDHSVDTSTWAVSDFQRELKVRGIGIGGKKDLKSYRSIWQAYLSDPKDYNLYTIAGLKTLMTNRGIDITKTMKLKNDFIAALQAHDVTSAIEQAPPGSKIYTPSPLQQERPQPESEPSPHRADDTLAADNARLRAENQILHGRLDVLQQAHDNLAANNTQMTARLNTLQESHDDIEAGFNRMQQIHMESLANVKRLTVENQTARARHSANDTGVASSQIAVTHAAGDARLTAISQTLRDDSLRTDNNIRNATSRPTMLLASVTIRGRTDRFLIPLPLYHFTTWARPTSDTTVEESGSIRVTVHLMRQDIDPVTSRIRDRDVILRVDGQGIGHNGGGVTVEMRLITIQGPLSLDQFRTHTGNNGSVSESADQGGNVGCHRVNASEPHPPSGRSAGDERVGSRHSQSERDESSDFSHSLTSDQPNLYDITAHQRTSESSEADRRNKRAWDQIEQECSREWQSERLRRNTRRRTTGPKHDNSDRYSIRGDPKQQVSSPSLPTYTQERGASIPAGIYQSRDKLPREGGIGFIESPLSKRSIQFVEKQIKDKGIEYVKNQLRRRGDQFDRDQPGAVEHGDDNPSTNDHDDSRRQTEDPHDMASDPRFANFLQ